MKPFRPLSFVFILLVGTAAMCVKDIPVEKILLDDFELEMAVGDTRQLTYRIRPADATMQEVVWASVDSQIASVDKGVVKALKPGSTDITVRTVDGGHAAKCLVKVVSKIIPVSGVALETTSCEILIDYY